MRKLASDLPLQDVIRGVIQNAKTKLAADEEAKEKQVQALISHEKKEKTDKTGKTSKTDKTDKTKTASMTDAMYIEKLASACDFIAQNAHAIEPSQQGFIQAHLAKMAGGASVPPAVGAGALTTTKAIGGTQAYKKDQAKTNTPEKEIGSGLSAARPADGKTQLENNMTDAPGGGSVSPTGRYPEKGPLANIKTAQMMVRDAYLGALFGKEASDPLMDAAVAQGQPATLAQMMAAQKVSPLAGPSTMGAAMPEVGGFAAPTMAAPASAMPVAAPAMGGAAPAVEQAVEGALPGAAKKMGVLGNIGKAFKGGHGRWAQAGAIGGSALGAAGLGLGLHHMLSSEKNAFAITDSGHKADANFHRGMAHGTSLVAKAQSGFDEDSPLTSTGGGGLMARLAARHHEYAAKKHEDKRNAFNPFGGYLTPSSHEKTKTAAADAARDYILHKLAGEDVLKANISAQKSGGPLVGEGVLKAHYSTSPFDGPGGATGGSYGNSGRKYLASIQAAINMTKGNAKGPQKTQLSQVLSEPALSPATDSKLQENLRNTGAAGVKIAADRALLMKIAREGTPQEKQHLRYLLKQAEQMMPPAGMPAGGPPQAPPEEGGDADGCTCGQQGVCPVCKLKAALMAAKAEASQGAPAGAPPVA